MPSIISISLGAVIGAIVRWKMGEYFNPIFPTLPLGTLLANLTGSLLMGAVIFFTMEHSYFSYEIRLGLITGFLGSLTTFSTFSAEAFTLLSHQELFWLFTLIGFHVVGSLSMVAVGYAGSKLIFRALGV